MSDRAREGLFSSLGGTVTDAAVLDLFAGTGSLGIEALSRGARSALFVDSAPAAIRVIRENLRRARLEAQAQVRRQDVLRAVRQKPGRFDLILMDPPYRLPPEHLDDLVRNLEVQGTAAPGGRLVLSRPSYGYVPAVPINWRVERRLSYGDSVVIVLGAS